ncbi:MAG: S10 family peptidase [Tepidisphaeraceae bacterium]
MGKKIAGRERLCSLFLSSVIGMSGWCASASFADAPSTRPASPSTMAASHSPEGWVVTHNTLQINGKPLNYQAMTDLLPLTDDAGKTKANMFFVAYSKRADGPRDPNRPITFVFNGGPGAAAVWLHLGAAGPMRVATDDFGHVGAPPSKLVPNPDTWLDATDLVFIDPVGTGYSRPAEGVKMSDFTGTRNDLNSVAEFIRLFLTENDAWGTPVYLAGESYGTTRAAALSAQLAEQDGIAVSGIVLMSTVLNFATLDFHPGNDLGYELYMPSFATIAWYHHKLSPEKQELKVEEVAEQARAWMQNRYLPALAKGSTLSSNDRQQIALEYASWTGLPADVVLSSNLRISGPQFEKILLHSTRQIIGRFDGRMTGYDLSPQQSDGPDFDPSLSEYLPAYTTAWNNYVRNGLKYQSNVKYEVLSPLVQPWDFGHGNLNVSDDMVNNLVQHPFTKVLICSGYYDLATPFAAIDQTMASFDLSPALRKQIQTRYFTAGHMMYHNAADRKKLHDAIAEFVTAPAAKAK